VNDANLQGLVGRQFRDDAYVPQTRRTGHFPQCMTRAVQTSAPISISA
jgi:hypothetical protein